ncbi:biotin--[acetyl-CoA-carboxylase] ligase [Peredibacter starrii]|uniref:Biotin--[acetyl-CoA-carboxylase] ligase n=1 Tax=Peredibacter starrii TaxID=28202 RepID=A0AAX4HPQ6_9BACT|nr:biotin--[acetyl-CoA-carboxylase] ligase [Peredibacter starrii]WPU65195.1 biotin--[acetyl-CoA-carboxylase] ligase [Peredibacter starrii]
MMIRHIHVDECDSTQDILKEQLSTQTHFAQFLVSCENQVMGRGRGSNVWKAMPGTVCFSTNLAAHPTLSFTALELSVLVARFFEARGRKLLLKWPNDLWDESRRKCVGILVQGTQNALLAGIGLNLFSDDENFGGIFEEAFALDKKHAAREIFDFINSHRYTNKEDLIRDWEARCGHMNEMVTVTEGSEVHRGSFVGIGEYGECLLKDGDKSYRLYNGSLRLIR